VAQTKEITDSMKGWGKRSRWLQAEEQKRPTSRTSPRQKKRREKKRVDYFSKKVQREKKKQRKRGLTEGVEQTSTIHMMGGRGVEPVILGGEKKVGKSEGRHEQGEKKTTLRWEEE